MLESSQEIGLALFKINVMEERRAMEEFEVDYIIVKLRKKPSDKTQKA